MSNSTKIPCEIGHTVVLGLYIHRFAFCKNLLSKSCARITSVLPEKSTTFKVGSRRRGGRGGKVAGWEGWKEREECNGEGGVEGEEVVTFQTNLVTSRSLLLELGPVLSAFLLAPHLFFKIYDHNTKMPRY